MIRFHVDSTGETVRHLHVSVDAGAVRRGVQRFRDWYDGDTLALLILLELLDAATR